MFVPSFLKYIVKGEFEEAQLEGDTNAVSSPDKPGSIGKWQLLTKSNLKLGL